MIFLGKEKKKNPSKLRNQAGIKMLKDAKMFAKPLYGE